MRNAAMKSVCEMEVKQNTFTANLEDGSSFIATSTELRSSSTPGRGDVWVIIATDRTDYTKTLTITVAKAVTNTIGTINEDDEEVSLFYNNYIDIENPTYQAATSGTIQYNLDIENLTLIGSFNARIKKSAGNDTYLCTGHINTSLISSNL